MRRTKEPSGLLAADEGRLMNANPDELHPEADALHRDLPQLAAIQTSRISAVSVGSQCDLGRRRTSNQDRCAHLESDAGYHLFVVADGMGGHRGGEVAAQIVTETCEDLLPTLAPDGRQHSCSHMLHEANRRMRRRGCTELALQGMGSTGTLLMLTPSGHACVAHVGDSRAYLARNGELHPLTEDHSLVASLVRAYQLDPVAAGEHPKRNELLRSLGSHEELQVDESAFALARGDRFVLCSDGLWTVVSDSEILAAVTAQPPEEASRALVALANERGGPDNITVLVIAPELRAELMPGAKPPARQKRIGRKFWLLLCLAGIPLLISWILASR